MVAMWERQCSSTGKGVCTAEGRAHVPPSPCRSPSPALQPSQVEVAQSSASVDVSAPTKVMAQAALVSSVLMAVLLLFAMFAAHMLMRTVQELPAASLLLPSLAAGVVTVSSSGIIAPRDSDGNH